MKEMKEEIEVEEKVYIRIWRVCALRKESVEYWDYCRRDNTDSLLLVTIDVVIVVAVVVVVVVGVVVVIVLDLL